VNAQPVFGQIFHQRGTGTVSQRSLMLLLMRI
jgi:hypothetical protein